MEKTSNSAQTLLTYYLLGSELEKITYFDRRIGRLSLGIGFLLESEDEISVIFDIVLDALDLWELADKNSEIRFANNNAYVKSTMPKNEEFELGSTAAKYLAYTSKIMNSRKFDDVNLGLRSALARLLGPE